MYKEEKTFNVLRGIVPNFKKEYKEPLLKGADPVLPEGGELIPVEIDEEGKVTKADLKEDWYSYKEKRWANAIIPTEEEKETVTNLEAGQTIDENQIESYFVWIPKYRYKLFDEQLGEYTTVTKAQEKGAETAIEIQFGLEDTIDSEEKEECATPMLEEEGKKVQGLSGGKGTCKKGKWMTHPAFISFDVNGLWVGKFETSKTDANKVQIKPDEIAWGSIILGNAFTNSKNYKETLQSHMMKNTEWGAVAYLTQSIYGRCEEKNAGTTCSEITINNNSSLKTGYSGDSTPYISVNSAASSTTNNHTGIYDMNGGAWEFLSAVMYNSGNKTLQFGDSKLTTTNLNDKRYYDAYQYNASENNWKRRILGDATGELGPFGNGKNASGRAVYISSYFQDNANFVYNANSWFLRGSNVGTNYSAGIFSFGVSSGVSRSSYGFRVVLAVK